MANKDKVSVSIKNDHTKQFLNAAAKAMYNALELCGQQAERNAKINLEHDPRRVDTGLLRNSITHAMGGERPPIDMYYADAESKYDGHKNAGIYQGTAPDVPLSMYIGTNVEYAPYVHEGTQKMAPNRFLRNAVSDHEDEYKTIIETIIKKING